MSNRDPLLLIEDIIESTEKIERYIGEMVYSEFIVDEKTKDAVIRNFEKIGEAANRLGTDFHQQHHEIEWNRIRGFATGLFITISASTTRLYGLLLITIWDL